LAVAEGLVLAGLPGRRRTAVGERGRVHAFEAVVAVEVLGAGSVAQFLVDALLVGAGHGEQEQEPGVPHRNTSARTALSPEGSSTAYARSDLSMRRTRPVSTLPGPSSMTVSTPFSAIFAMV